MTVDELRKKLDELQAQGLISGNSVLLGYNDEMDSFFEYDQGFLSLEPVKAGKHVKTSIEDLKYGCERDMRTLAMLKAEALIEVDKAKKEKQIQDICFRLDYLQKDSKKLCAFKTTWANGLVI